MSILAYHHSDLITFLREVRDTTSELSIIASKSEEWKLFNLIINAGHNHIHQANAAQAIGVNAPYLRKKVQPSLNKVLRIFSERCGIKPPIRLYFNTMGDYPGGHFACCDIEDKASKSEHFIRLEDLQRKIKNALQRLGLVLDTLSQPIKLKYLQNMWHILQFDTEEKAIWFRSGGPIAADFKGSTVIERNELLKKLNELVLDNGISILEGNGGTGKSVLVRNFAYNFINTGKVQSIYHYSFKSYPHIGDLDEFLNILNGIDGIVIVEDIHLASTSDIHSIVNNAKLKNDSHLLLTARPSYKEHQSNCYSEKLLRLPTLPIRDRSGLGQENDYSKDIFKIIDNFIQKNPRPFKWADEIKCAIKEISDGDLWLLSYALEGCTGEGEALGWIRRGVRDDLKRIEKHYKCNPQILLTLCPLYRNEILTAKSFLTQTLNFDRKEINELVRIGEVIEHDIDGEVFYGLQHSSLALAYWEHGNMYKDFLRFSDCDEYAYQYAISGVSNGLTACLATMTETSLVKINNDGETFLKILEKESSLQAIHKWLECLQTDDLLTDKIIDIIAHKILLSEDIEYSVFCILKVERLNKKIAKKLYDKIGIQRFGSIINLHREGDTIVFALNSLKNSDSDIFKQILRCIDIQTLAEKIKLLRYFYVALRVLWELLDISCEHGYKVWELSKTYYAEIMKKETIYATIVEVSSVLRIDKKIGRELLDFKGSVGILQEANCGFEVFRIFNFISFYDKEKTSMMYEQLDLNLLYQKITNIDTSRLLYMLYTMYNVNPKVTLKLIKLITIQYLEIALEKDQVEITTSELINYKKAIKKWKKEIEKTNDI